LLYFSVFEIPEIMHQKDTINSLKAEIYTLQKSSSGKIKAEKLEYLEEELKIANGGFEKLKEKWVRRIKKY
jgi:hypothetical protein